MKKVFLLNFILIIICFSLSNSFALQIKNVNYSASNNNDRWIEVFNDGGDISDFTISDYKILDSKDTTKHSIVSLQGDTSFPANTSIYISPSVNIPIGATKVFRSSYSLDKTNGYISIINSDNSATYSCFAYGNISCPAVNQISSQNNSSNNNSTSTATSTETASSTDTSLNTSSNVVYVYLPSNNQNKYGDISVLLPEEKIIPAGADYEFTVKAIDQNKKPISSLDFDWSFGDGGEKFGQKVSHNYVYPGDYVLVVSADGYTVGGEAKMNVKVITPDILISKVGKSKTDNFIDLQNNTDYDIVLSNFYLSIDNIFYKLPKNFTIAKKKTVHVSGDALGFNLPATNLSLNYPNKNILTSYINIPTTTPVEVLDTKEFIHADSNNKEIKAISDDLSQENTKQYTNIEKISDFSTKNNPQNNFNNFNNFISLKKLILNANDNKKEAIKAVDNQNLNKGENVDTGIVDWFKSLIY